jgi:hypothetical protein
MSSRLLRITGLLGLAVVGSYVPAGSQVPTSSEGRFLRMSAMRCATCSPPRLRGS